MFSVVKKDVFGQRGTEVSGTYNTSLTFSLYFLSPLKWREHLQHLVFINTRCCKYSLIELLVMGDCFARNM
jgi:hypothetical protein